jgi:hypothetical protein
LVELLLVVKCQLIDAVREVVSSSLVSHGHVDDHLIEIEETVVVTRSFADVGTLGYFWTHTTELRVLDDMNDSQTRSYTFVLVRCLEADKQIDKLPIYCLVTQSVSSLVCPWWNDRWIGR